MNLRFIAQDYFCTRWNGIDKASGVIEALDDEEYTGSLILLLEEGMTLARRNSKKMWKKESDRRVEYPEYPERSIFEGLVNGLVHRDYLDMGSEVHIDIFDDRLEIYSPGGMYDGTLIQDRDIDNVPSKRRNPVVADILVGLIIWNEGVVVLKRSCRHMKWNQIIQKTKSRLFIQMQLNSELY